MSIPEAPTVPKPQMPKSWRLILRVSGAIALLLFLTPTFYVLKFNVFDRPREEQRAQHISLTKISPTVPLDTVAPPLPPEAPGNAAAFYVQAIQSVADRYARGRSLLFPTSREAAFFLEGARRRDCRFFSVTKTGQPEFVFYDPDLNGTPIPYVLPHSPEASSGYLSAALALAEAMSHIQAGSPTDDANHRAFVGRAILRFGEQIGQEKATRTHLAVAHHIKQIGVSLLLPLGGEALKKYVYAQQAYEDALQAKYHLLEATEPDNILLQVRVAHGDADPFWRREAIWALGKSLRRPGVGWERPMEALQGKSLLAEEAIHDPDASVRATANDTWLAVAQNGAVIQR